MTQVAKACPWGPAANKKAISLDDIVREQQFEIDNSVQSRRDEEDADYQFALMLQNEQLEEQRQMNAHFDDRALAEVIQFIEDEEMYRPSANKEKQSSLALGMSKVSIGSNMMEVRSSSSAKSASSSCYAEAEELRLSLEQTHRATQNIHKHDPLLQGLSNAESLSELDGVGDLVGSKILVGNRVSNSLKTFVHKNEGRAIRRKIGKAKKASVPAAVVVSSEPPAPQNIPAEVAELERDAEEYEEEDEESEVVNE